MKKHKTNSNTVCCNNDFLTVIVKVLLVMVFFIYISMHNVAIAKETSKYVFGVFPHMSLTYVEKRFSPVVLAMSDLLDAPIKLGTAADIKKFRKRVLKNDFDIAIIPPLDIVPIVDEAGYIPLARRESRAASIVVLSDSSIKDAADLKGKTLGVPKETPVEIFVRLALPENHDKNEKKINYKRFVNVQSCLHKMLLKKIDACATASGLTLKMFQKKMTVNLRKIMETHPFPHMLIVANPKMSLIERKILTRAILGKNKSAKGKKLLKTLGPKSHFIRYKKTDYDIIRKFRQHWVKNDKSSL